MVPDDFRRLVFQVFVSQQGAADYMDVERSTINRYATGNLAIPRVVEHLIRKCAAEKGIPVEFNVLMTAVTCPECRHEWVVRADEHWLTCPKCKSLTERFKASPGSPYPVDGASLVPPRAARKPRKLKVILPDAKDSAPRNMHLLASDIATAGALVINIAVLLPGYTDPETVGDLVPIIAADVSYWRRRRAALVAPRITSEIAARRAEANHKLYDLYRRASQQIPQIHHGTEPGDPPESYVDMLAPSDADDLYLCRPKAPPEYRPPGRPGKYTSEEITNMAGTASASELRRLGTLKPRQP